MSLSDIRVRATLKGTIFRREITVEGLTVNDNGTYTAPSGKAYSPVVVNLALGEKAITANGEYNASADDLRGYSKVTVAVEGFKVKDMPTGAISSFDDGTDNPLKELKVSIVPVQSGSGDPSPSNPRPISGWSSVTIHVADGETPHIIDNVTNVSLGQTVYGGELDVTSGELTLTLANVDMGTLYWTYDSERDVFSSLPSPTPKNLFTGICSIYPFVGSYSNLVDKSCAYIYNKYIAVKDHDYTNATEFKTAMNGVQFVYELATPQTYQLTPTQITTLLGTNNIWADCGDVISGKYFASL